MGRRSEPVRSDANPKERTAETLVRFYRSVRRALSSYQLKPSERDELLTAFGYRSATERLLASNKRLRVKASHILIDEFAALRRKARGTKTRFWHFSFLGPIITEYKPRLDLDAFRAAIDSLLRTTPLSAVIALELQPLTNYPQKGEGRGFLLNAHALTWTNELDFDAFAAARAMSTKGALHSELGAKTVVCTERDMATSNIEWLGYYLLKAPADGKWREYDKNLKRWVVNTVAAVRSDLQLRLAEILSQLELTDLVHGFREGSRIRSRWKRKVTRWNAAQCARLEQPLDSEFDTAALWQRIRSRAGNGSRHSERVAFFGPKPRPIASEKLPRADGKRIRPSQPRERAPDEKDDDTQRVPGTWRSSPALRDM